MNFTKLWFQSIQMNLLKKMIFFFFFFFWKSRGLKNWILNFGPIWGFGTEILPKLISGFGTEIFVNLGSIERKIW